jgi:hypothetical protein
MPSTIAYTLKLVSYCLALRANVTYLLLEIVVNNYRATVFSTLEVVVHVIVKYILLELVFNLL